VTLRVAVVSAPPPVVVQIDLQIFDRASCRADCYRADCCLEGCYPAGCCRGGCYLAGCCRGGCYLADCWDGCPLLVKDTVRKVGSDTSGSLSASVMGVVSTRAQISDVVSRGRAQAVGIGDSSGLSISYTLISTGMFGVGLTPGSSPPVINRLRDARIVSTRTSTKLSSAGITG
jgi:hypothetical protein